MILLTAAFFVTAALYASVGFGGGSTYIALLLLAGFAPRLVPLIAPVCNIIVVTGGVIRFARAGTVPWRRVLPLVVASAPFAYLGGLTPITERAFVLILGLGLFVAGLLLVIDLGRREGMRSSASIDAGLGASVGYVSGLVGIGGGIFLSPIQHLIGWANPRAIAATASVFILVNALAGFAGQITKLGPGALAPVVAAWPLAVAVVLGGQIGTLFGLRLFSEHQVRRATGLLILSVAGQLLWKTLAA